MGINWKNLKNANEKENPELAAKQDKVILVKFLKKHTLFIILQTIRTNIYINVTSLSLQAKDKKFLNELACDKEYLEDMLVKLSTHTHANKLEFHKDLASKVLLPII